MTTTDLVDALAPGAIPYALNYAEERALPDTIELENGLTLVRRRLPGGGEEWLEKDRKLELHPERPLRSKGTIRVHTAESFVTAVESRGAATVYTDDGANALVAVLNDDALGAPGFRDYRVALELRPTPEWAAWKAGQGLGDQQRFAERIEDGELEIRDPAPATMLDIAQTFHASVGIDFRSGTRLANGQTQLVMVETIDSAAGPEGSVTIPEEFLLVMRPFLGSSPFEVRARLRYRVGRSSKPLEIGYTLVRPEEIERLAFEEVVELVEAALRADETDGATFIKGPAPEVAR